MFQHIAARRRLGFCYHSDRTRSLFQHTAARRRLARWSVSNGRRSSFNTQPPEGGWIISPSTKSGFMVSTHSRPKAAGKSFATSIFSKHCFNTQPPEGGWDGAAWISNEMMVSTHSRPKAAGIVYIMGFGVMLFQHTAA